MPVTPYPIAPRVDLRWGFVWIALGALVVFGAWRMDSMAQQGATLHSAPGLWPGIVGLLLAVFGGVLVLRSLLRARETGWTAAKVDDTTLVPRSRFYLAASLFLIYSLLLVGRGLPFWLVTALFVSTFVFVFRRADRQAFGTPGSTRGDLLLAASCGIGTALIVSVAFQELFYVRLP